MLRLAGEVAGSGCAFLHAFLVGVAIGRRSYRTRKESSAMTTDDMNGRSARRAAGLPGCRAAG